MIYVKPADTPVLQLRAPRKDSLTDKVINMYVVIVMLFGLKSKGNGGEQWLSYYLQRLPAVKIIETCKNTDHTQ